jgi:hypothetical protein
VLLPVEAVCPEWTKDEVLDYLVVYLRLAGLCGLTSLLFVVPGMVPARSRRAIPGVASVGISLSGMFQAHVLARNLRDYKCEYI